MATYTCLLHPNYAGLRLKIRLTGLCSDLQANSWEMLLQVATVRIEREVLRIVRQYANTVPTTGQTRSTPYMTCTGHCLT